MDVVLTLKSKSTKTSYKLNLKIIRPIIFIAEMPANPQVKIHEEVRSLVNFFLEPLNFDYNSLLPVPNVMKILCNENDFYTGYLKVIPFSFKNLINEDSYTDVKFTVNDINWKTTDSYVSGGNLIISGDSLPTTRIVPREQYNFENNKFDIFVDVTGISENYSNTLQIDYVYGDNTGILEVPVKIIPSLTATSNIEFTSRSFERSTSIQPIEPVFGGPSYAHINNAFQIGSLGEDTLTVNMLNTGLSSARIKNIELESPYVFSKQLTLKYNKFIDQYGEEHNLTQAVKNNLDNINEYISLYEADFYELSNEYKSANVKDSYKNMSLDDKELSLKNYISYKVSKITNGNNLNGGASKTISATINLNKLKPSLNNVNGKVFTIKVVWEDVDSSETFETYLTDSNKALSMVAGVESLTYDTEVEDIKYIRPNTRNTLYFNLTKKVSISDF